MSSGYYAIFENFLNNDIPAILNLLKHSDSAWVLGCSGIDEALKDLEDGYYTLYGPDKLEALFSKNVIAISNSIPWKSFLFDVNIRTSSMNLCESTAKLFSVDKLFYVPNTTFLSESPMLMFANNQSFKDIVRWCSLHLKLCSCDEKFEGERRHLDVYFEANI